MHAALTLKFERAQGVWIADLPTRFGRVEVIVGGSDDAPDESQLATLEPFFARASEIAEATKKKLKFPFLYRLVRIAPNQQGRIGLQFLNRLTGAQSLLLVDK